MPNSINPHDACESSCVGSVQGNVQNMQSKA